LVVVALKRKKASCKKYSSADGADAGFTLVLRSLDKGGGKSR